MALTVSGDAAGLLSAPLALSFGAGVDRNQPLSLEGTGEVSGLGDREGNEVRLLVSSLGEGARLRLRLTDALELRLEDRTRWTLRLRGLEMVELCEAVRTRSTDRGASVAAMLIKGNDGWACVGGVAVVGLMFLFRWY